MWSRKTDVIGSCDLCYRAATDKDTGKMQDTGKASPQPFNQPQQNRSRSRFDALRVTEQQVITKNQENANDRGERLRSVLAQQQQKKNRDHER